MQFFTFQKPEFMFVLEYSNQKAAVVLNGRYIYEFASTEEAKSKIDQAEGIYVDYPHNGRVLEKSPSVLQQLKVKSDGYGYDEL